MRDVLAERLLAKVMEWGPEDIAKERPHLQAMALYKYDNYQQFYPGMRFVESLALWLAQFESSQERNEAYRFVRYRLIYISESEMAHLVSMAFPDVIRPFLINLCAERLSIPIWQVRRIYSSIEFQAMVKKSLYLGLSDGAHIDLFRRSAREINNEQVRTSYEISNDRIKEMQKYLRTNITQPHTAEPEEEPKFQTLFLLDDFTGSGLSYLRKDSETSKYSGKLNTVLHSIIDGEMSVLFDINRLHVCLVIYLATEQAKQHLEKYVAGWLRDNKSQLSFSILPVQILPDSSALEPTKDNDFCTLLEKYFDKGVVDPHYMVGEDARPWLGFNETALPLVLNHNTPNNSLPLLWLEDHRRIRGLFPRVSRHKE